MLLEVETMVTEVVTRVNKKMSYKSDKMGEESSKNLFLEDDEGNNLYGTPCGGRSTVA